MKLNYLLHGQGPTVVLLHGLFGNLDNLGGLARDLIKDHQILQIDLRNHGLSDWSDEMNYSVIAQDLAQLFNQLQLNDVTVIGHSMGGKAAMALTEVADERIKQLIILDIAPVAYANNRHTNEFNALRAVTKANVQQRREAAEIMREFIPQESTIQFLLKSFRDGKWLFNVEVLSQNYANISGWQDVPCWQKPVMFIAGGLSPYMQASDRPAIIKQFPNSRAYIVAGAGHWVHGDKPQHVLRIIRQLI